MDIDKQTKAKSYFSKIVWVIILLIVIGVNYSFLSEHMSSNNAFIRDFQLQEEVVEKYKEPAVSAVFYSANKDDIQRDLGKYMQGNYERSERKPKILIVPYAGYKYSSQVATAAYSELLRYANDFSNVVIIGAAPHIMVDKIAVPQYAYFNTSLGKAAINQEKISELLNNNLFVYNNKPFDNKYLFETQLFFLQKNLVKFKIIPIMYGTVAAQKLAAALQKFLDDENTLLVFLADLSHYYKVNETEQLDAHTVRMIDLGNSGLNKDVSCGAEGINAALLLAKEMQMNLRLWDISHFDKINNNIKKFVDYDELLLSGETEDKKQTKLEKEVQNLRNFASIYGQDLLAIAKQSIIAAVNGNNYNISRKDYPDVLFDKGASFVTLTKQNKQRGYKGSLVPRNAIADDVARNAKNAALESENFEALRANELSDLQIAISFLTGYEKIEFSDEVDLLQQIVQGTDGIVLRDGNRQGVLLPAEWNEFKNKKEFLEKLKLKAGLSPKYWSDKIKAYRFRTVEIKRNEN